MSTGPRTHVESGMRMIGRGGALGWVIAWCGLALGQPHVPTPPGPPVVELDRPQAGPGGQPMGGPGEMRMMRIEDLPPPARLGARAEVVRRAWPVIAVVVVVPDADSYIEAVGAWTPRGRFPVLIDDGTVEAREQIGRFVRGFEPRAVMRWKGQGLREGSRQERIERAVYRVWSASLPDEAEPPKIESMQEVVARWMKLGVTPPGLVAADAEDPAWPAALALSAGRMQPIAWVKTEGNVNATMSMEQFGALAEQVESACGRLGLQWRDLGDQLDAVTVCLNAPAKVMGPENAPLALTDLLARHDGEQGRAKGARWAWTGQVFGDEAESAYRAMSALFVMPGRAWLFDGYPSVDPWTAFDATKAGEMLAQTGMAVQVEDAPKQSSHQWRIITEKPLNAGLILVNTKGNADEFSLEPGRLRPGDLPILHAPAAVYFVHSFSAAAPAERTTIAGRWMERGAYAYCGSVHEPYLHAFVPTPIFAARMVSSFAWGAAVRIDESPAWKVATIGDPLMALGPPAPRTEEPLPLEGATDLKDDLAKAMREKQFTEAAGLLVMLGRDAEAARLAAAVRKDAADSFDEALGLAAGLAAFRAGDFETLAAAVGVVAAEKVPGELRDALWLAAWQRMGRLDESSLRVLEQNLRADQIGPDASELARGFTVKFGRREAAVLINAVRERARTEYDRIEIEDAMKRYGIRK
jgi:hypothetical protein